MTEKKIYFTSNGLNDKSKKLFFEGIGKEPSEVRVIFVPTAGIATDGARESFAIGIYELFKMGIKDNNILVYNLELVLSKGYERTYSSYIDNVPLPAKVLNENDLLTFDAILVGGGESTVLCKEMVRTGFNVFLKSAIEHGLTYVGISAGSMYAAGNLKEGMHLIDNSITPHWDGKMIDCVPMNNEDILLSDGQVIYVDKDGRRLV